MEKDCFEAKQKSSVKHQLNDCMLNEEQQQQTRTEGQIMNKKNDKQCESGHLFSDSVISTETLQIFAQPKYMANSLLSFVPLLLILLDFWLPPILFFCSVSCFLLSFSLLSFVSIRQCRSHRKNKWFFCQIMASSWLLSFCFAFISLFFFFIIYQVYCFSAVINWIK